jgi:regulator of sigma E protease
MDILVKVGQLLLSLSILIILHEMGHFFPARWFKTRVDKFFLFFDAPPFNSLFSIKRGDTEYGIGWLPLGGYVKIAGMVDESMDTNFKNSTPQPWEFRSKPAWQRLIIMLGGVTVNFILGFLIMGLLLWVYGHEYVPTSELRQHGMAYDSILLKQGFRNGDLITHLGNEPFDQFEPTDFIKKVVLGSTREVSVLRDGQTQKITIANDIDRQVTDMGVSKRDLINPRFEFWADKVQAGMPAAAAGVQVGDRIIGLDSVSTPFFNDFVQAAQARKGQASQIVLLRGTDTLRLAVQVSPEGTVGIAPRSPLKVFKTQREDYSLARAIPAGIGEGMDFLSAQISAFGKMFSGKISASKNLGGFISIGNMFPAEFNWEAFWHLTATLSLILAFMNLLPIPALDGGYVVFLIWEVVTGRKVSDNFMEKAVTIGFFLLIGLLIYANGLDVWRNLIK